MISALALAAVPSLVQTASDLELVRGDTVALLGNATAERMQHHGWFETELHTLFPELDLVVRNLGFGGDALTVHQRTDGYGKFSGDGVDLVLAHDRFVPWDRYLDHVGADVVLAFFGFNESFDGPEGLPKFRGDLESFVDHMAPKHRLVLCGPLPHEASGPGDSDRRNAVLLRYGEAMRAVAGEKNVRYVDLFGPMGERFHSAAEPLTINGVHLNERGNAELAQVLASSLFPAAREHALGKVARDRRDAVRALILEKNGLWFERYRPTDDYNTHGGRSRMVYTATVSGRAFSNFEVLQREKDYLDVLVANRDRAIHAAARREPFAIDDSNAPPLIEVETNKPGAGEAGAHVVFEPRRAAETIQAAPGFAVGLWADEQRFPELVNPVQMAWDTGNRLWVAVWPGYPHRRPDQPLSDKLIVLADTNGDGEADTSSVFADGLHNPTGFEFWNGGVLLAQAPDLVFLEDTDGDGRADRRESLLHGLSSADTHHSANSFVIGPEGALYFQEGTFHRSQVESPHGPVRNLNGCVWRFDPRTWRVERYVPYNFANPHGHVFDRWGQDFVTDGTGNQNYYALPFSGHLPEPLKHAGYFPFFKQRSRPAGGTEFLSSRHFPDANQGNYLIANVIGFRGIFQYEVTGDGSGFQATEVDPVVESTDPNFRPVDLEIGPDGALYFLDWHNPLIGHLQHHLRDPSRDSEHGRVYRVSVPGRALVDEAPIAGRTTADVVALLGSPEDRTRYRARIELGTRDADEALDLAARWLAELPDDDPDMAHHALEVLWLGQRNSRVNRSLLETLLAAHEPRARAAAVRVVRHSRHELAGALDLLRPAVNDEHPRVRLEAVVAASFFPTADAASIALEALNHPTDRFLDYALAETIRGLEVHWRTALREGRAVAFDNPAGIAYLLEHVGPEELVNLPRVPAVLRALTTRHGIDDETRRVALDQLAKDAGQHPVDQLADALLDVDGRNDAHAAHVLSELGALLLDQIAAGAAPARSKLAKLKAAKRPTVRALGQAAAVVLDGEPAPSFAVARANATDLLAWIDAVRHVPSAKLRSAMGELARPFAFHVPGTLSGGGPGSGLDAQFFEPSPRNARRETFESASPSAALRVPAVTIDVPPARASDSFGMSFRGTLFAPESGSYVFETISDDGSRLYLNGRCVVDNDGDHGMVSQRGAVTLDAGAHELLVTYFEQGGGEGLIVNWQIPGGELAPLPASALGTGGSLAMRTAAIHALAHAGRPADELFEMAQALLGEGALLEPTVELLRSVPREERTPQRVTAVLETLSAYLGSLAPEERTAPRVEAALVFARELAASLPQEQRGAVVAELDGLGGRIVLVRTVPHEMLYDVTEIVVEAGRPVSIVFQNNDVMPHNLVIVAPGALEPVGRSAEALVDGPNVEFVPSMDEVLWHTRLILPGETERLTFIAPEEVGDYPYLCTYPGHWRVMNGVLRVVAELGEGMGVTRRSAEAAAPARTFVRDWTFADLAPSLEGDWQAGRSLERGGALFEEAGCIKCHAFDGQGADAGPELSKLREKYDAVEMLRHVLEPSLDVLPEYVFEAFELEDDYPAVGRVVRETDDVIEIVETLLRPNETTLLDPEFVLSRRVTELSPMPNGLLVTLNEDEILDLVHFLQEGSSR